MNFLIYLSWIIIVTHKLKKKLVMKTTNSWEKINLLQSILEGDTPPVNYNKERRRSTICRAMRDPDEILRSLKAVKGELLGRSGSISEKRRSSKFKSYVI